MIALYTTDFKTCVCSNSGLPDEHQKYLCTFLSFYDDLCQQTLILAEN